MKALALLSKGKRLSIVKAELHSLREASPDI